MAFYFLPGDLQQLDRRIQKVEEHIRAVGREMGESCTEGAETYHDNFAYEDGERQLHMLSKRLREMVEIRNNAKVVAPDRQARRVGIGRVVTFLNLDTEEERTIRIGSFMVLSSNRSVSYQAPLARLLMGACEGELREGRIGGSWRCFEVQNIS